MRRLRKMMDVAIPIAGAVIVFLAVILIPDFNLRTRVATVLVGVLMIEAGVWKLTSPFFGSEREYTDLRREVDRFIPLVRSINKKAIEARADGTSDSWIQFREAKDVMHRSVDEMARLAGKVSGGAPTEVPAEEDA